VQQGKYNKTLMNEIALSIDLGTNFIQASMAMYKRVDLKTSMKIFKPAALCMISYGCVLPKGK
jgi:hypothetical protein